jgi:hypothetical protein
MGNGISCCCGGKQQFSPEPPEEVLRLQLTVPTLGPNGFLCVAIGDIEGQVQKLQAILQFIEDNPNVPYVFLGDIFNNLSAQLNERELVDQFRCVEMLRQYLEDDADYDGPRSFEQLRGRMIERRPFDTNKKVQFVAGNHELRVIGEILEYCPDEPTNGVFEFTNLETPRRRFRITNEQLRLLYQLFKSMNGQLDYTFPETGKSVHFRHAEAFTWDTLARQESEDRIRFGRHDLGDENNLIVCGHSLMVGCRRCREGNMKVLMIDPSVVKSDCRVGLIGMNGGNLNGQLISLPFMPPRLEMLERDARSNLPPMRGR